MKYTLLTIVYLTGVYSGIIIPKQELEPNRQPTVVPAQQMNLRTLETLEFRRAEPDFVEL